MTRTWAIDDNSAMPIDMVREQDFILRLRRLHRVGTAHLIVNLVLSAIPAAKARHVLEGTQNRLKEFAKITNATYSEMSNGDVFLVWEETDDAELLAERLSHVVPADVDQQQDKTSYLLTYHLPGDYVKLRERSNHYIEVVRAAVTIANDTPAGILKGANVRGPLTAWGVDQIGKLLDDINLRAYSRTQPIYALQPDDHWQPVAEEYFISFDDLRRERFPKLDLITPEHLFLALCEVVDQHLLALLTKNQALNLRQPLQLNLSVASVIGSTFAQFTHSVPRDKRGLLTFELHRGDLFQDFARTLGAIEVMRMEGFKVAIDSVTPDMLPYIDLNAFAFDQIKINVSGDRASMLRNDMVRKALQQLPPEKLVFFRCDSKQPIELGRELGVALFQGWHIDDLIAQKKEA